MILFNANVERLRMYDPGYYAVKEVKMQRVVRTRQMETVIMVKRGLV